ncbi:hypothetical protein FOCC_FOCC017466 [Frankliniella occidentalis]|nr:hypothetical protein FOCC_FOCC017466 [Frankliniella occidentalis]
MCVSTRPVNEVVCAVSCVMNAWSKVSGGGGGGATEMGKNPLVLCATQSGTRPLPWRCTDSGWKRQRVKLLCPDGSTRSYRIRVVQTCRCVPRARATATTLANQLEHPNTCVIEEVPGTKHKIWTECKYWADRDICGRKAVVRYDCCEGFSRELTSAQLAALRGARANNPILNHHIVANKMMSKSWGADQQLLSRLQGSMLRVNKYSSKIETVNCATIVRKDQEATNGVVHIVDALLDPERSTHVDLSVAVEQDGRFRQLSRLMQRSELFNTLRRQNVAYTLFAPNDEAFQKIPVARLQRLEADDEARDALLRHLVVPHPVCVGAVVGPHRFPTRGAERLAFDCDARGATVAGVRFGADADMTLATDGLLYMLDDVPLPNRVKTLLQLVQEERLYSFAEVVRAAGLESLLDGDGDYTLFAPSEAAMACESQRAELSVSVERGVCVEGEMLPISHPALLYKLDAKQPPLVKKPSPHSSCLPSRLPLSSALAYGQLNRLRADQAAARSFVMLHLSRGRIATETITDNQVAQTLENDALRLQVYRKGYGVEDALIERPDVQGLNGVLHVITKCLRSANVTLEETLRQDGNYTTFLRAMDRLREDSPNSLEFRGSRTAYTFLVPSDQAFQRLGVAKLQSLLANTTLLARTLKNHVVDDMVGTESFRENLQYTVPSRQSSLHVTRADGKLRVNDATVLTCDRTNRQGVVHYINKVLIPEEQHVHVTVPPVSVPRVRWEEQERTTVHEERGEDDDDYVDPDLGPQPEVYRGRPGPALQEEHRYREEHVAGRGGAASSWRQQQHHQQQRVQHAAHHYLHNTNNYYQE